MLDLIHEGLSWPAHQCTLHMATGMYLNLSLLAVYVSSFSLCLTKHVNMVYFIRADYLIFLMHYHVTKIIYWIIRFF